MADRLCRSIFGDLVGRESESSLRFFSYRRVVLCSGHVEPLQSDIATNETFGGVPEEVALEYEESWGSPSVDRF